MASRSKLYNSDGDARGGLHLDNLTHSQQMKRISVACVAVALVICGCADGASTGGLHGQRILTWDSAAMAVQMFPAISVQPSGGDDLAQVLRDLVGEDAARALQRNRRRIAAALIAVALLGIALIVGLVIGMKKREARAVAALDRERSRGQNLRDLDRRRMRDEQP